MRKQWGEDVKSRAKRLRKEGYSFGRLTKTLDVPKSTLHQWMKGINRPKKFTMLDRQRWIKTIQPMGAQANHTKRLEKIKHIEQEVKKELLSFSISKDIQKAIVVSLYLAEGSKGRGTMVFANTDPRLILLFISSLRNCFEIDEKKFRVRLHLHWYHKEKKVKEYWSKLLHIPLEQFGKTYHKQRSKEKHFRKNIGGICFLKYNSDYLREQILHFGYALGEKIVNASVV